MSCTQKITLTELPEELILDVIRKLDCIDIINLYTICRVFKNTIDVNIFKLYKGFIDNGLLVDNFEYTSEAYWHKYFTYYRFLDAYKTMILKKKESLIVLKYIYRRLSLEMSGDLFYGERVNYSVSFSMHSATNYYLKILFPQKEKLINYSWEKTPIHKITQGFLKNKIEEFIDKNTLDFYDVKMIFIDGFNPFERFNYDFPDIYVYNSDYTNKQRLRLKIKKEDINLFKLC